MNKKTFNFFRFLAALSIAAFVVYLNFQATWALYTGIIFAASFALYVEIKIPESAFKKDENKTTQNNVNSGTNNNH